MIVYSKYIPFKGFKAMAIFPFIFVRAKYKDTDLKETLNHEAIHFAQQKEMLIIFFYLLYFIFWIFYGYKNIPFEKEAYENEHNKDYLKTRKLYSWWHYLKNK